MTLPSAYGSRVMGRVRRRRTVRVVGVGGGTVLTAGALVLGATHMPWGVLGAAPGDGTGAGVDCATPSPATDALDYSVIIDTDHGSLAYLDITNAYSGTVIVGGVREPDGTYTFTDGVRQRARRGAWRRRHVHGAGA